jgi:hypothetical protein
MARARGLALLHNIQTESGVDPAFYPVGTRAVSLGTKGSDSEADHSHPSNSELKYGEAVSPLLPSLHGAIRHKNFTSSAKILTLS